ncbi:uncharacterized protein [Coffea arabica]|uniref:Retrotransposon gag domain-containing protein n=1 Tax=Coffea arabica TaxID=13443 RepID=A0ABM4W6M9_COFAR
MSNEGESQPFDLRLQMEDMMEEFRRMLRNSIEPLHERMEQLESSKNRASSSRGRSRQVESDASNSEDGEFDLQPRVARGRRNGGNESIKGVKLNIPSFQGKSDPETYLEWEHKIELVSECNNYSEQQKVKLAAVEFTNYASVWWDQLRTSRRKNGERAVETWGELKGIMRRRFVPSYYHRELHQRLQTLTQGDKSVEDYFKDMEMLMMRADVNEDAETTMAQFLNGLKSNIAEIVELQHYMDMSEMLDKAVKVER